MTLNLKMPDIRELKPRITVFGVGGAGGNAVNNMIQAGLKGVDFVVANTDAQALTLSKAERIIQMGVAVTEGLGAGSMPEIGRAAADEVIDEINDHLTGAHMVFITAGMGGGTGTGAAPVIAKAARDLGILTVGVVTKPFQFEGQRRMRVADAGIEELQKTVDTLIVIPNQNLFRIANERTTFADAFAMADQVLYSGVACITDLMVKEGLINLDFADVRSIMRGMGKAMMGTGESSGEKRALQAAEAAIANPLIDETSMKGSKGVLISISGGKDLTLFEVDEAATRIREEVDPDANIILGATFDDSLEGVVRVSVVATGIDQDGRVVMPTPQEARMADLANRLRAAGRPVPAVLEPQRAAAAPAPAPTPARSSSDEMLRDMVAARIEAEIKAEIVAPAPVAPAPAPAPVVAEPAAPVTYAAHDPAVAIQRYEPQPQAFAHQDPIQELEQPMARPEPQVDRRPYIPPTAERPASAARMPRVDEFPPIAQRQMSHEEPAADDERRPMSLLKRLAHGLGRREDEEPAHAAPSTAREPTFTPVPAARETYGYRPAGHEEFAKRPAPRPPVETSHRPAAGQLDPMGRQPAQTRASEEDQLEIPAFLRRQAN
ncbi:cell division protein FtsZ [Siculibacillus lacustris]|uniref:Cell division protein FtsZ n=1 Tax=Siculibacillus lacustris TaxID=1549641 RepID=A0A4Q9VU91_9HYPH|nr:cell division protein FtsZ [Siculibacillus lacustris]TBW38703.1 cell division protein FtsZ [Siculibacillus lacustris]